jgi:hypothetical protein
LGLPFLPVVLGGDYHFLASAAPVPGGAVDNYLLWEFHPLEKAQLVYGLLGGTVASPDFEANGITILAMVGDLLAALMVLGYFGWAIKSMGHTRASGNAHAGRPLGLFALIAVVYLVVGLISTVNARHMVAAWPAIAIMTGVTADAVLRRLASARSPRWAGAGGAVLLCGLAIRPLALGADSLHEETFSLGTVAAQSEIVATVKSAFYADHEAFDAHAALFWRPGSRAWQLVQEGVSGQMTFVYQSSPAPSVKSDSEACLAIVEKQDMTGDPRTELVKSPPFSGLAPVFAPMAAESAHFAYFPYTTTDGNCLKSFPNAYIPTHFEATFLSPGDATAQATQTSDAAQFVGFLPGRTFPIGLELRRSGSGYRAVLHGRLLRGYTGLRFATIVNPTLCLVSEAGVRVVPVGRLPIGSPQRGSLTPWQSPLFALPDGTYHLWLVGRDGWTPQAVQIALGLVVLPNMQVAAPEAGSAAPPVGCPVPIPGAG